MEKSLCHESPGDVRLTPPFPAVTPSENTPVMKPIHLVLSKPSERVPLCGSRFWGHPDLPRGYPYPCFPDTDGDPFEYTFICQINLSEVAPYDTEGRLPHRGLLSFFAKIEHYLGRFDGGDSLSGYISEPEDVKVLFFPEVGSPGTPTDFQEMVLIDDRGRPIGPEELRIDFSLQPSGRYCDEHALFAPPTHREWETWDPPFEDWEILLQVDSFSGEDFQLNFMDFGVLVFLIAPQDLALGHFEQVRGIVLST